jgi:hypothetical protein
MKIKEYDKREAQALLETELERFRALSWSELRSRMDDEPFHREIELASNNWYQIEINVFWDDKEDGDIRVVGCIDDGGFRSYLPQSSDFILSKASSSTEED